MGKKAGLKKLWRSPKTSEEGGAESKEPSSPNELTIAMNNWIFEAAEVNELDINELPSGNTRSTRGGGGVTWSWVLKKLWRSLKTSEEGDPSSPHELTTATNNY